MKIIRNISEPSERPKPRRLSLRERAIRWARRYGANRSHPRGQEPKKDCRRKRCRTPRRFKSVLPMGALIAATGISAHGALTDPAPASRQPVSTGGDREVRRFESSIAQHGFSAPVLFNLANAFARQGKTGDAILNYERALWFAPHDEAILSNLRLARKKAGIAAVAPNPFEKAARVLSPNTLAWVGSAALALLALGLVAGRLLPDFEKRRIHGTMAACALVLALVLANIGYWYTRLDRAVILASKAPARIAPASEASVSFNLREGQIVRERKQHGDYVLVRTDSGNSGWVDHHQLALIIDRSARSTTAPRG